MSKPFDYSKWDNIELSDDEDDVHPNIDKESWFRMKHRSRVEREDNEAKERKEILAAVRYYTLYQWNGTKPLSTRVSPPLLSPLTDGKGKQTYCYSGT